MIGPLDIIMDCGKKNSIWFDSPFINSSARDSLHLLKVQIQHEPEEAVQLNSNIESPLQLQHKNTPKHIMSPWSKLLLFNEFKEDQIQINNGMSQQSYQNAIIEQKVVYSDPQIQEQITPIKRQQNQKQDSDAQRTTAKKQQRNHPLSQRKAKILEKGLRRLSQRAFQIVCELKYATYKQVASMLAQQLNYLELEGQNREEQNIKRRVYDALNVLIALGVLRKDGRKIVSQSVLTNGNQINSYRNEELNSLRLKLQEKQLKVTEKRELFRQTESKYRSIQSLLSRNMHKSYLLGNLVHFPFIGVLLSEEKSLSMDVKKTRFILRSQCPGSVFGDMDCLKWLGDTLMSKGMNQERQEGRQLCKIQAEWP